METVVGLVVIALVVLAVRAVVRSSRSRPAPPYRPPSAGAHVRSPAGPRPPSAAGREAEFPPETVDDAFAVGFIMGREFGHHDEPATSPYADESSHSDSGDDDWADDGGAGADW